MLEYKSPKRYDLVVCQAVLRHVDHAENFLRRMVEFMKPGGLLVSIESNREFEADGLYIDGMDYAYLCNHDGLISMWEKELKMQNRDYSVAMKIPQYMKQAGLVRVDARLNDRVTYMEPEQESYEQTLSDLIKSHGWDEQQSKEDIESASAP